MDTLLGLCIGIGLSAACGFRVFVPLLAMSVAAIMGIFEPLQGFEWLALPSVCLALAVATVFEIGAYYIPWVDNLLDTIATPAALVAGTLTTMAVGTAEMSPFASWAAALIVGGGTASAVQLSTVALRGISTTTTGGIANPIVSTGEWISAILLSVLSLLLPIFAVIALIIALLWVWRWMKQKKQQQLPASPLD